MKPGAGKNKGSAFEREVCRALTKWITGKTYPEIFWRTAASGGKATQDFKAGRFSKMQGDIKSIEQEGEWLTDHFFIECKFYKKLDFDKLVFGKGLIAEWMKKAAEQGENVSKDPFLIIKENRGPIFGVLPWQARYKEILAGNFIHFSVVLQYAIGCFQGTGFQIFRLDEFFKVIDPKTFHTNLLQS